MDTKTPIKQWTKEDVSQWLEKIVQLPQYSNTFLTHNITGEKLLSLTLRDMDRMLGIPNIMHCRKIEFGIHKLKEEEKKWNEEAENRIREHLVMQKMENLVQQIDHPSNQITPSQSVSTHTNTTPSPSSSSSSSSSSESESTTMKSALNNETDNPLLWTIDQTLFWLESLQLNQYKNEFLKHHINGEKLLSISSRDLVQILQITDINHRRRLEYEIARLKERVESKSKEKQEQSQRRVEGQEEFDPSTNDTKFNAVPLYLSDGVYLHKMKSSPTKLRFEIDATLQSVGQPIFIEFSATHLENVKEGQFGTPHKVFVIPEKGKRHHIVTIEAKDLSKPCRFKFQCTQRRATLDDFLEAEECKMELYIQRELQLLQIDASSPLEQIIDSCRKHQRKFIDPVFPPLKRSLYIDLNDLPKFRIPIQWKRPEEFFPQEMTPKLFSGSIDPGDIQQGRLGDCWFLGALSVIASRPELVLNLFITKELSQEGIYTVQFHRGEEWVPVTIDDYLPCVPYANFPAFDLEILLKLKPKGKMLYGPVYTWSSQNDLWVSLLEKGYAKLNKSYQALTSGTLGESLTDLTGAPCVVLDFQIENKATLWQRILNAKNAEYLMGCATRHLLPEEKKIGYSLAKFGLVDKHGYALLDVREVYGHKLLRVRNPWGYFEWNGDWSDNSSKWTPSLRKAVDFKSEPGAFWICWEDFQQHFNEVCICLIGKVDNWTKVKFTGVYSHKNEYGPQVEIFVTKRTQLYITLSKKDLRFSCGADIDNSHGLYILKPVACGEGLNRYICMKGTCDSSRREVTMEITLEPADDPYILISSARIGNVKFESVEWTLTFLIEHSDAVTLKQRPTPIIYDIILGLLAFMKENRDKNEALSRIIYSLMFYAHNTNNRRLIAQGKAIPLLKEVLLQHCRDKHVVKEGVGLIWDLASDLTVQKEINEHNFKDLILLIKEKHYQNVEIQEICDIAIRQLSLEKGIAMDPLIEKCLIANACTFSVTGSKTYLSQSWHDCYTCNLRTRYGVCSVCAEICHKGHNLSLPKFGRFFCDCGHGKFKRFGVKCQCVKSLQELGLQRRREVDEDHIEEEEEDPQPDPIPFPFPFPNVLPSGGQKKQTVTKDKPRIRTLFDQ